MVGVKTEGDIEAVADTLAAIPEVDYVVFVGGLLRPALRDRVRGRRAPALDPQRQGPEHPRRPHHRHLHVPPAAQADLRLGNADGRTDGGLAVVVDRRRAARGQGRGAPRRDHPRRRRGDDPPLGTGAHRAGRGCALGHHRRRLPRRGRGDRRTGRSRVGACRARAQGEGTAGTGVPFLRPDLVLFTYLHLAAYPEVARALLEGGHDGRRVRDGATRERTAAFARADERSRGAHGAADRRALPRACARRARRPARWRARRSARARRRARRGQRRLERGVDRAGHGSGSAVARQEPRSAALGRPDPQGSHHDAWRATAAPSRARSPTPIS